MAVAGDSSEAVPYSFTVTETGAGTGAPPLQPFNLGLNVPTSGTLTAGETEEHTFVAAAGTKILFDSINNTNWQIRGRLINPDGSIAFDNHDTRSDLEPVVL